jgi:hypothetical protein
VSPDRIGGLPSEVEQGVRSTLLGNVNLQVLLQQLVHELEELNEIRLAGTVRTNQHVEWPKLQIHLPDRQEALELDAVQPASLSYLTRPPRPTLVVDTGGLYALYDTDDAHHAEVRRVVEQEPGMLIVPVVILAELDYLLREFLGVDAELDFLDGIARVHPKEMVRGTHPTPAPPGIETG